MPTNLAARVAELQDVVAKMTPGEWKAFLADATADNPLGRRTAVISHRKNDAGVALGRMVVWPERDSNGECEYPRQQNADAVGIVTLRNTAPRLVADLMAENERLKKTLVAAALPLEALHSAVQWELCVEIREAIAEAVEQIRAALAGKDGGA